MNLTAYSDYFALFNFKIQQRLQVSSLEDTWRSLAAQVHPDRFVQASAAEQRQALQYATMVNEAYQTLKHPLSRARYILSLVGVDTQEDTNTSMPMDFLMEQIEWREAIEDARHLGNIEALEKLAAQLNQDANSLEDDLTCAIDEEANYIRAAGIVRKLRFLEKLEQEVSLAVEALLY